MLDKNRDGEEISIADDHGGDLNTSGLAMVVTTDEDFAETEPAVLGGDVGHRGMSSAFHRVEDVLDLLRRPRGRVLEPAKGFQATFLPWNDRQAAKVLDYCAVFTTPGAAAMGAAAATVADIQLDTRKSWIPHLQQDVLVAHVCLPTKPNHADHARVDEYAK